ncbi:MAG TPA: bacillithiol biosynthesis cysteine-adding enzyme BshC [Bacillales bacterium]
MDIRELTLPQKNQLASRYIDGEERVLSFFDYAYTNQDDYSRRASELKKRTFPREELADVLHGYNSRFSPSEAVLDNIEKLKDPESLAVIGGQQAGVLTGPLFTIHKCLSIIQLARQQEKSLGVPVVPVFWIAGEDHDFDEVNHTYVYSNNRVQKNTAPGSISGKQPVSDIALNKEKIKSWVEEIISSYGETEHTRPILRYLNESLENSATFVDWFAHLIMSLFKNHGLVLVNSADSRLRSVEVPFFKEMIERNGELNDAVLNQIDRLRDAGFEETIDIESNSANLFYHFDGDRILLERDKEGNFRGKNNECLMGAGEFLAEVESHPNRVSNNVVTRPLMQELLFPTLAFIAGPGEIAYWSTLKEAFRLFGCRLPLLVPRLNITLVDRQTEKWLNDQGLSVEEVLNNGVELKREQWLEGRKEWDIESEARRIKNEMDQVHKQMRSLAMTIDPHLDTTGRKNIEHVWKQIDYFADQIERTYRGRYNQEMTRFDRIEACLLPKQGPQERIWSIFPYLNRYGMDLVGRLTTCPFEFNGRHKIILL